jgi:AbrB family looped-hinge helix DNA binding protein
LFNQSHVEGSYLVKVHKKGLIVIPSEVRRKLGIAPGMKLELLVEDDSLRLLVPRDLRSFFGIDGEKALKAAKLILEERRREREQEVRAGR